MKLRLEQSVISLPVVLLGLAAGGSANPGVAAERSNYQPGAIVFGKQLIPTQLNNDLFIYPDDLNGDGYTDFVITGFTPTNTPRRGGNLGSILLNNGDNTFKIASGDAPRSEWARELLVRDFNGDGIRDLFIADHGWDISPFPGFKNQLLLGTGSGFTDVSDRLPNIEDFSHNAAAGDIDKDGDVDIIVTNNPFEFNDERSYLLLNDGTARFTLNRDRLPASFTEISQGQWSWAVELADLDGDGWEDLIVGRKENANSWPSRIHWNRGDGTFSDAVVTNLPTMANFVSGGLYAVIEIQAFDVDLDGDKDVLMSAYDASFRGVGIQLLRNAGGSSRSFSDVTTACLSGQTQTTDSSREPPYFFRQMDINFDGVLDIAAFGSADNGDNRILAFEGAAGDKLRGLRLASLTSDPAVRLRISRYPARGANEFGFLEIFRFENNGTPTLGMNYVPLSSSARATPAVEFDGCSNRLRASVEAGSFGKLAMDLSLVPAGSDIQVRILPETVRTLSSLPASAGQFNAATGELLLPELVVEDAVAYRNVRFRLIDSAQLLFRLVGTD